MSGTGVQTITGVVDRDGTPFVGKQFIIQSAYAALNTVTSAPGGAYPYYASARGVDDGTIRSFYATGDAYSPFNFKAVASGESHGDYSMTDVWADNFSGVQIYRTAYISAIRSGEFDVTFVTNARNGDDVLACVLGGDGLDLTFTNTISGTYTTPSKPQGLLALFVPPPTSGGGATGGAGGQDIAWGFATRDGAYGACDLNVVLQGENWSAQRTDGFACTIDPFSGALSALSTVSAWTDTSFTIGVGAGGPPVPLVFSGEDIVTAGGVLTQPASPQLQTIDTGIDPHLLFFWGIGQESATTVYNGAGQIASGWATSTTQVGYWGGEKVVGNPGPPSYGVRYLADDSVVRFGDPNGSSTTFDAVASVASIDSDTGIVTLDWSSADSTPREVIWFALGVALAPPVPPPTPVFRTREVVRRRLRRSPITWSEKDGLQTRVRVNLFAIDMQPGVGTAGSPNPQVMVRASKDGGFTWGNERFVSAGRVGEYLERLNTWQWGQGRDWVFEIACSDPVTWFLVNAYLDAEGGTN